MNICFVENFCIFVSSIVDKFDCLQPQKKMLKSAVREVPTTFQKTFSNQSSLSQKVLDF